MSLNNTCENVLKRKSGNFNCDWSVKYLCKPNGGDSQCLLCKKYIQCKTFNIKRHYDKFHNQYEKYSGDERLELFQQLSCIDNSTSEKVVDRHGATRVSYAIIYKMIKGNHCFSDGEFIKACILEAVGTLSKEHIEKYNQICLSRRTISRRVQDMASDYETQLERKISSFISVSLALDESTDTTDISQLAIFIRGVDTDFNITEELLDLIPLKGTTTGQDIFDAVVDCAIRRGLDWSKVFSVATDGAKAMTGSKHGFIGRLKEKFSSNFNSDFIAVHCLIHQEALCAKSMAFKNVMDTVVKCTNIIRSKGLNHRQFNEFLESVECEHVDIPYFSEIRWLSRGGTLKRFFDLRSLISTFLISKKKVFPELNDAGWIADLAFLTDITEHLDILNLTLQGKDNLINDLSDAIRSFKIKLGLWSEQLAVQNFNFFLRLKGISEKQAVDATKYSEETKSLRDEFSRRFAVLDTLQEKLDIFSAPFMQNIESAPPELQMELIELQCCTPLKYIFLESRDVVSFYKILDPQKYPAVRHFAANIISMFGSTYTCEQFFSKMKLTKSNLRNRISDVNFASIMRIAAANAIEPNLDSIIS